MDASTRIGVVLKGKYQLEALLGCGGMAAVYRATHRNGNRVAVKILHPELSMSEDVRARFLREGYVANRVQHKGAVRVLDDDVDDDVVFLVMELLEGETLEARWTRSGRHLLPDDVAHWATALLETLGAAHAQGIVHRDVKPENLFLTTDGDLKVLDFGIARLLDAKGAHVTRTGRLMGTPAFLPPEQALGYVHDVDARSDLFAVGATMFTLLAGRYVHEARTVEEMLVFAATRQAAPLRDVVPECPAALADVIDRALAFDKNARFPDATSMQAALARASFASVKTIFATPPPPRLPVTAPAATPPTAPTDAGIAQTNGAVPGVPSRTWPLWAGVSAVGVVALVGLVAIVQTRINGAHAQPSAEQSAYVAPVQAVPPEPSTSPAVSVQAATVVAPPASVTAHVRTSHSAASSSVRPHTSTAAPTASSPAQDLYHP